MALVEVKPVGTSKQAKWARDSEGQWWNYPYGVKDSRRGRAEELVCKQCGKTFLRRMSGQQGTGDFCSRTCSNRATKEGRHRQGPDHPNWRGGHHVRKRDGYVQVYVMGEGGNRVWKLEHRLVMENHLGRKLTPHETVHHLNGDNSDNRLENLELWTRRHGKGYRIKDAVKYSIETLRLYDPDSLADHLK